MNDWITIMTFTLPSDAYLAQSFLESEGIETMLLDELMAQGNIYANAIGGVKLQVKEFDYQRGLLVLKKGGYTPDENPEFEQQIEVVIDNNITDKTICPFCGSKNTSKKKEQNTITDIVYAVLGVFSPLFKNTTVCSDCGKEWKYIHQ